MSFAGILYREFEIAKIYFVNFALSFFSNAIFIIILFLLFNGANYFSTLTRPNFLLISYIFLIIQNQIFYHIYSYHDRLEKIFDYTFPTINSRFTLLLIRFCFILVFNLFFLFIFYSLVSFKFDDFFSILLFIISVSIIIYNNLVVNLMISRSNDRFISYFLQILLIVINFPAIFAVNGGGNLILLLSSASFAILNSLIAEYFSSEVIN